MPTLWVLIAALGFSGGLERPGVEFKVFQFPADRIPRIDGSADDWSIVPDSYAIGIDQMRETVAGLGDKRDPADLDVKVKVGWVKGQNHLYFLYEASDNYWDFAAPDLHNDIFELVIDGDLSGGPFIRQMHPIEKLRDQARHALPLPRRPRPELPHLHARRGQGLGDGLGLAAVDQGLALCQRGVQVRLQARRRAASSCSSSSSRRSTTPRPTPPARSRRSSPRTKSSACPGRSSTTTTRRPSATRRSGTSRTRPPCTATRRTWSRSASCPSRRACASR